MTCFDVERGLAKESGRLLLKDNIDSDRNETESHHHVFGCDRIVNANVTFVPPMLEPAPGA
jgi:hypothetical protein